MAASAFFFFSLFSAFFCLVASVAAEVFPVEKEREAALFSCENLALLRDIKKSLIIDEVRSSKDWKAVDHADDLRLPRDLAAFWLRARLMSPLSENSQWVVTLQSSRWEELDWYIVKKNGELVHFAAGNARSGKPGELPLLLPNLPVSLEPQEEVTLYLRAYTRAKGNLILKSERLEYFSYGNSHVLLLISFGGLAVLVTLGFIFSFYGHQEGALAYALSIGSISLVYVGISGLAKLKEFPFHCFLAMEGVHFFSEVALLAGLFYMRSFFNLKKIGGVTDKAWRCFFWLNVVFVPCSLLMPLDVFIRVLNVHSFLHSVFCFVIGIWSLRRGVRFAKFYLLSWLPVWLCIGLDSLYREGAFPVQQDWSAVAPFGILLSKIFLFLSLVDKVRQMARDYEKNQQRLLQAEQEQNELLETKVMQRTLSLEKAKIEAEKANRYKDLFLSNMSHEIRTPLSALIGLSQILVHEGEKEGLPTHFTRMLGQIKSGGNHLDMMLTNLLDVGAARHGKIPLRIKEFCLKSWLKSVQDILEPLANSKSVQLQWQHSLDDLEEPVLFRQDALRMSQILINLAHNAIKFSPAQEAIVIFIKFEQNNFSLEVRNKGTSLPEDPSILFEKFQQNDVVISDNQHGVGLGLYIVKSSVELMQGTISAKNCLSQEVSFCVLIPNSWKA